MKPAVASFQLSGTVAFLHELINLPHCDIDLMSPSVSLFDISLRRMLSGFLLILSDVLDKLTVLCKWAAVPNRIFYQTDSLLSRESGQLAAAVMLLTFPGGYALEILAL